MNCISRKIWAVILCAVLFSCSRNPLKIDISGIQDKIKIVRFEQEMNQYGLQPSLEELQSLREKYPEFTDIFTDLVIRIGILSGEESVQGMHAFLNDTMILSVNNLVGEHFRNFDRIEAELTKAFKHYRYYFPEKPLPEIYTCISGFNESAFVSEGVAGISLDKYLGLQNGYYSQLGIPRYKQRKMIPEMIPADVMYVWAMGEFEIGPGASTLLDHMIYEGKLMYFLEAMMPSSPDTLLTGFTEEQVAWCKKNESQMWTYLVERDLLYSTKRMDIVRYINDGPQTNGFPPESPGRTGAWLGRQIIRQYMKRNPDVTLEKLMNNQDYQGILNASAYLP